MPLPLSLASSCSREPGHVPGLASTQAGMQEEVTLALSLSLSVRV